MKHAILPLIAAMLTAAPAWAQSRPDLSARRDETVTYQLHSDARGAPASARVLYQAGGAHLRVEADNQPGYVLVDRAQGQARLVMASGHLYSDLASGDLIGRYVANPDAKFRKLGQDSVLGRPCTRWALQSPDATGEGCVSADGVILEVHGTSRRGEKASLQASKIDDQPIPPAAFALPADAHKLDLSGFGKALRLPQ